MASEPTWNTLTVSADNSNSDTITISFPAGSPIFNGGGTILAQANGVVSQNTLGSTFSIAIPTGAEGLFWMGFPTLVTSVSGTISTSIAVTNDITVEGVSPDGSGAPAGSIAAGSLTGSVSWNATGQSAKSFTRGELAAFLEKRRRS